MSKSPSLVKIITIDYAAFMACLLPVGFWGIYIVLAFSGRDPSNVVFLSVGVGLTIIAIAIILWRIRLFYSIFADHLEATATISQVSFFRDRGRVEYTYTHQGQKIISGNAVHKTRAVEALQVGQTVVVLINRDHPRQAFICDLYT